MPTPPRAHDPVRVLWVIKGLGPGGAEALLVSSARAADPSRVQFEVAYIRPDKDHLVAPLAQSGVVSHLIGADPRGSVAWPARLRALMSTGQFDVVHVHSPLPAGVARLGARTVPARARPEVVSTEHNLWGSFSAPTRVLNAATAGLDAHRWAVSDQVRDSMSGSAARRSEVLIHGIDLATDDPAPGARVRIRAELGIPAEAAVAVTIANLRREKDYPNLLRAARAAIDSRPDLYVLAAGQGPLMGEMRRVHSELDLGPRVQLLGYRPDTADLLAASDIFVLASAHEGYPISLMEAMAQGLPIVATAVGGVPDAVQSGVQGALVPPRDSAALARAITEVAGDPMLRSRMSQAALAASARFDIRRAVERQSEVYEELAARRRARASTP